MECINCNSKITDKTSKFCPNCGEKVKVLEIKKDLGEQVIADMEKLLIILESKKKEENKKLYSCPFCNKELSLQLLKSKLNREGMENEGESPSISI